MKQNENTKYVKLGITGAAVLAFGFAIMYILNQSKNIAAGIQLVFNILKPFLYGALIAYLLAPICNRMDERFLKWFPKATEKQKKGLKFLSIAIAVICAVTIVVLLILLILPQVWDSTVKIIKILPARLAYCNRMIDQLLKDQPELQTYFNHFSSQVENGLNDVLKANSSMMTTIQGIVNNITVQLIEVLSVFKNMFLGFLIAVYLLASRKLFGAQAKLLLYGIFPNKWAKIIEEEVHYTDKMFNGFFVGKIIDSAIIGLICFAGTTLLGFESAAFISVVLDTVGDDGKQDDATVKKAGVLQEKTKASYPFLIPDSTMMNGRLNGISAFPETFFVDKEGNIVGETYSGSHSLDEWKEIVEKELANVSK